MKLEIKEERDILQKYALDSTHLSEDDEGNLTFYVKKKDGYSSSQLFSKNNDNDQIKKKWVSVDEIKDYIKILAAHPHYNVDDSVQQFAKDILQEVEK
jgi:hypothetical protein